MVRGVVPNVPVAIYVFESEFVVICWCWEAACNGYAYVAGGAGRCLMPEESKMLICFRYIDCCGIYILL